MAGATGCGAGGGPGQPPGLTVPASASARGKLVVYSGGHVRPVLQPLVQSFSKATGVPVSYSSGASGRVLALSPEDQPDVYIAADLRHVRSLERRNLVAAKLPLAHHRLAILVKAGNPKGIRGLNDLSRSGLRVYVEDPGGCQVGAATARLLARNKVVVPAPALPPGVAAPNLRNAARYIQTDLLDAAIVWDSTARRPGSGLGVVQIPLEQNENVNIVAVVLRSSNHKALAEQFVFFLRNRRSGSVWENHGFHPGPGERAKTPPVSEPDPR